MMFTSRLNNLAKSNISFTEDRSIFTEAFINDWTKKSAELVSSYLKLVDVGEKNNWLRDFFIELFQILYLPNLPNNVTIPLLAQLITELSKQSEDDLDIIGKAFIASSTNFSKEDDNKLLSLAKHIEVLNEGIFKYSHVSSKLMTKEQIVLMKHLLKKTKFEVKKYNLLFECSTGYGNLISLLYMAYYDIDNIKKVKFYTFEISHIIGKFSLDPMRSLDIILKVSSEFITENYEFFIQLIQNSDFWPQNFTRSIEEKSNNVKRGFNSTASSIIVFNINSFKTDNIGSNKLTQYCDMCCILVKIGFINFYDVWHNIAPNSISFEDQLTSYQSKLEKESLKGANNPLAMAAALSLDEDDSNDNDDTNSFLDQKPPKSTVGFNTNTLTVGPQSSNSNDGKTENNKFNFKEHLKLFFLDRLLAHGCYSVTLQVFKKYPYLISVNKSTSKLVSKLFDYRINDLYENLCLQKKIKLTGASNNIASESGLISHNARLFNRELTHDPFPEAYINTKFQFYFEEWASELIKIDTVEKLFDESHEYFEIIGPYTSNYPALLSKLSRIGVSDINNQQDEEVRSDKIEEWINYTRKFLLPTLALFQDCPSISSDIFALLELFSFEKRYFLYNEMLSKLSKDNPLVRVGFIKAEKEAKRFLKSLNSDNIEQEARKFSSMISSNPLATITCIIEQVENYDKVSELVIIAAKYFNYFAYDVLQYILLQRLSGPRKTVQDDGVNPTSWVSRISSFIAGLTKDCPYMDINNIITYIIKTLHKGSIVTLSLLKELLLIVGGIRDLNEVNTKQLHMLNSGVPLKRTARNLIYDTRDKTKDQGRKLIDLFLNQNALSEIILLLYNMTLEANTMPLHYKILSGKCDELNSLLWSFIELTQYVLSRDEYRNTIIPLQILLNNHHVSTPWLFHIWRSTLGENRDSKSKLFIDMKKDLSFPGIDFSILDYELFISFWTLQLYDINYDGSLYTEAKNNLEKEIKDTTTPRKISELKTQLEELTSASISQQGDYNSTTKFLEANSTKWTHSLEDTGIESFLQYCIIPRALFNPSDALYCSSFISQTFNNEMILKFASVLFESNISSTLIFSCTSVEAGNFGIFFQSFLQKIENIRKSYQIDDPMTRKIYDWYYCLLKQMMRTLMNKNYMSIRNGIEFMKHVTNIFPIVDNHLSLLIKTLENNLLSESREDIKLPSTALVGHLKARLKCAKRKSDICNLTEDELKDELLYQSEKDVIQKAQMAKENIKKQDTIRKQLEANKAVAATKQVSISQGPAGNASQTNNEVFQVIRLLKEISYHITADNWSRILSLLDDETIVQKLKELSKQTSNTNYYKKQLWGLLEDYFRNRAPNTSNEQFELALNDIHSRILKLDHILGKATRNIYSEPSSTTSRYNKDPNKQLNTENRSSPGYRHPNSLNSLKSDDNKDYRNSRSSKRIDDKDSGYPLKRGRSDNSDSDRVYDNSKRFKSNTDIKPPNRQKDYTNTRPTQPRSVPTSRFQDSKRDNFPKLPQGPKGARNPPSRYQK